MDDIVDQLKPGAELLTEMQPMLFYRLKIYGTVAAGIVAYWIGALFVSWLLSGLMEAVAKVFLLVAVAGNWGILHVARGWLSFAADAGFTAVATQIVTAGVIPAGTPQIEFGKTAVAERYRDVQLLSQAESLVHGTLKGFHKTAEDMASWVPLPGMQHAVAGVNLLVSASTKYLDQMVISLAFQRRDVPVWSAVKDGVLIYTQAFRPMLKMATGVVLLDWLGSGMLMLMLLVMMGLPAATIFRHWESLRALAIVLPLVLTYVVRKVILEPIAVTGLIVAFQRAAKKHAGDPELEDKLAELSPEFKKIREKSESGDAPGAPAAPAPTAPASKARGGLAARKKS